MATDLSIRTKSANGECAKSGPAGSFQIERGEIFGLVGFSGTGKAALLQLVDMLDRRYGGPGRLDQKRRGSTADVELRAARHSIGVFAQPLHLSHERSVLANVALPLELAGASSRRARTRAAESLERVGLAYRARAYPAQLTAVERRIVAIARALASDPDTLLCDDPTAALDSVARRRILSILQTLNRDLRLTILIATQALDVVREICHAVAVMEGGAVLERVRLADLYAAPRTELGRQLFVPAPRTRSNVEAGELSCA